jgi:hypothetical protein
MRRELPRNQDLQKEKDCLNALRPRAGFFDYQRFKDFLLIL